MLSPHVSSPQLTICSLPKIENYILPECPVDSVSKLIQLICVSEIDYTSEEIRKESFIGDIWLTSSTPSPSALSIAGFKSTGEGDIVKCHFCGTVLTQWKPDDDPIIEHTRFTPVCSYLRVIKSDDFLIEVFIQANSQSGDSQTRESTIINTKRSIQKAREFDHTLLLFLRNEIQTAKLRAALHMGHSGDVVLTLVSKKYVLHKESYSNAGEIIQDVLEYEDAIGDHRCPILHGICDFLQHLRLDEDTPPVKSLSDHGGDTERSSILEERRRLLKGRLCRVCGRHVANILFRPCAHTCVCEGCNQTSTLVECLVCRQAITDKLKIFFG